MTADDVGMDGLHLARMGTRVALNALFDRLPNLRLDQDEAQRDDAHIHGRHAVSQPDRVARCVGLSSAIPAHNCP
ncbi:MAG TPA: hypothetical protein VI462_10645 [Acidimicrobiia bacterium]